MSTEPASRDRECVQFLQWCLPRLLRIWSAGCGAGEEPFTVALLLRLDPAPLPERLGVQIVATDLDAHQLERARFAQASLECRIGPRKDWVQRLKLAGVVPLSSRPEAA
ncbi:MAG: CheR family methyltransferase [Thermoanaerobaculia bacterium]